MKGLPPHQQQHKSSRAVSLHVRTPLALLILAGLWKPKSSTSISANVRTYTYVSRNMIRDGQGPQSARATEEEFFFWGWWGLSRWGGGGGQPCGSLEWCDRLPSLLVRFVGMWERRILAPGEPRQSAADFMPSVSASILPLPNSSDLYFLSLHLLLIPVHKSSRHTGIC